VDNKVSTVGSCNFGEEYIFTEPLKPTENNPRGIPADPKYWHDGLFCIHGSHFARRLNHLFAQQWYILGGDIFPLPDSSGLVGAEDKGEDRCALYFSFPGNPVNICNGFYETAVAHCHSEVIIENPYVISENFWYTLRDLSPEQAAKLRFIVSIKKNDHKFVPPNFKVNAEAPFKKGVRFYDYSECGIFSHWKVLLDMEAQTVYHGSTNLNTRSELHDFELNVLVKSARFCEEVKAQLDLDLAGARQLTLHDVEGIPLDKFVNDVSVYYS